MRTRETMIPKDLEGVLTSTPDILDGAIRFRGTKVPVIALMDMLRCGQTLDDFLDLHPGVSRSHALALIQWEDREARKVFGFEPASL